MSDQIFRAFPAVASSPSDLPIPNAAQWRIKTVSAVFDGTGGAAQFLPALQIIGPGGIVGPTFADPSVAVSAGGSAEVTFGPFLRTKAGGSGSGVTEITSTGGTLTVTNPFGPIVNVETALTAGSTEFVNALITALGSGLSGFFTQTHISGATLLNYATPTHPTFIHGGCYAMSGYYTLGEAIADTESIVSTIATPTIGGGVSSTVTGQGGSVHERWPFAYVQSVSAGEKLEISLTNLASVAHTVEVNVMVVVKIF